MKATQQNGSLVPLQNCYLVIPNYGTITFNILPDISDGKQADYGDISIIGRSFPIKTYQHSSNRNINITIHFLSVQQSDVQKNLKNLRAIQSCVYPLDGDGNVPYYPPAVCRFKCGSMLGDNELCLILKSYNVKFPTDVVWDPSTYLPMKYDVETGWETVYSSPDLPGASRILSSGD